MCLNLGAISRIQTMDANIVEICTMVNVGSKGKPKCHKCDKFGYIAKDYRSKMIQQVDFA